MKKAKHLASVPILATANFDYFVLGDFFSALSYLKSSSLTFYASISTLIAFFQAPEFPHSSIPLFFFLLALPFLDLCT